MRAVVVAVSLGCLAPAAVQAQPISSPPLTVRPVRPPAAPVVVPLDAAGLVQILTPFAVAGTPAGPALVRVPHYQGPDGTYDSAADLTNAINGVPCGIDCTARSLRRWGYQPE